MVMLALCCVATAPPLTPAQQAQLATAIDHSPAFDEAGLYPLLTNVTTWSDVEAHDDGPAPDYAALLTEPDAHRGALFVIEGILAATPRPFGTLTRRGLWDDALRQWPVMVDATGLPGSDRAEQDGVPDPVVLVYLLDNPAPTALPPPGSRVRATARFYKVWSSTDLDGRPRDYLTFVGRRAQWDAAEPASAAGAWATMFTPLLGTVLVLLAGYVLVRRLSGRRRQEVQPNAHIRNGANQDDGEYDSAMPPLSALPRDPAEAMARLAGQDRTESDSDARR